MSGSLRMLYADDPATFANNLRQYIDSNGIPATAENLNRLSLAVAEEMRGGGQGVPQFDAAVERTMAPRGARRGGSGTPAAAATTQPQQDAAPDVRLDAGKDVQIDDQFTNLRALTMDPQMPASAVRDGSPQPNAAGAVTRGAQQQYDNANAAADAGVDARGGGAASARAAQDGNTARPGTIPRARFVDENDPTAGMFDPVAPGGRQANEEGVNQAGLAAAILGGAAGAAAPGLLAGRVAAQGRNAPYTAMQNYQAQRMRDLVAQNPPRVAPQAAAPAAPQAAAAGDGWIPFSMRGIPSTMPPSRLAPLPPAQVQQNIRTMTGQASQPARNASQSRDALRARLQQRNAPNRRNAAD